MKKKFYKIPDGVTKIDKERFIGLEHLGIVYIPESVQTIDANSFEEMWNLRVLVVPCGFNQPSGLIAAFNNGFEAEVYELNPDEFVDEEGVIYQGKQKLVGTVYEYYEDLYGEGFMEYNIPDGVEEICQGGFFGCQELESVRIPNTVKSIRGKDVRDAFGDCRKLRELHIPESVVSLGPGILPDNLETLIIPEHLLGIALDQLYSYDTISNHLKKLHIIKGNALPCEFAIPYPDWIKIEELEVDANCVNYSSIDGVLYNKQKTKLIWCPAGRAQECDLPDGLEEIGPEAFWGCENLQMIHIPNSVTKIGDSAFKNCVNLKKLYIPGMVATIGEEAFCGCEKIKVVNVPKGLKKIGRGAFWGCEGVKKIFVSDDWEKGNVIQEILGGCPNVKEILVDKTCTEYCSKDGVVFNSKMTKLVSYPTAKSEKEYIVPDGVKTIGKNAFYNADVSKVFIPSSVTTIEPTFIDSHQLNEIIVDKDNPAFSSRDGVLFNKDKTILIHYPQGRKTQEYTVPETVDTIGNFAFNNCGFLKEVTKSASVKQIGSTAFEGCNAQII